jgi:hypothetical protein
MEMIGTRRSARLRGAIMGKNDDGTECLSRLTIRPTLAEGALTLPVVHG